ncbi:MAG: hypothetical protein A2521_14580 [Deltaproteobacteria bacterium RIFOXYD12_FULL_57_12]|nr:MAG: hypothetical protein A2521_14580 [Deltaproteobacteria bacterium RIFOXYD12_FULL_57_12]
MGLYNYSALNAENAVVEGVLEENDETAVARRLMLQGLRPLEIRQRSPAKMTLPLARFRSQKISTADINFFTKQIALLLNAGLPLDGALRVMKQQATKPAFKEFTGTIERDLKEGKSFSQALAKHPKHFSSMYVNMARAGEEGGILPAMLVRTSEYQSTFQDLKQFIISASIYPVILIFVGTVALTILVTLILPKFEVLFEGVGKQLPLHVRMLMETAKLISSHFFLTILLLAIPPIALISYLRTSKGRRVADRLLIRTPLLANFIRDMETTKIFRTLEVLVNNGVHLATALKISSGVASNSEYQHLLHQATQALKEGQRVGKRIKAEGLLPDLAVDLLSIGEESGRVGQVCGQIADHFENELRVRIKRLIALVEPVFIVFIAIFIGYVVFSMLSVILSISDIAV